MKGYGGNREDRRRDLKFYRIPRDPERRARWTAAIRRENWAPNDPHRLCSCHFIPDYLTWNGDKTHEDYKIEPNIRSRRYDGWLDCSGSSEKHFL
ncbi:THAP domain-containing protein 5-like [Corythoichthys intestinalis]|uniref:THAP domain-containing protein 5-like n=1 Tax=Corythoichthys intestinalis TaxID=161448 RepID=UPI0025A62EE4|nr:THAP domain-containing protein 5-like [Corythoichthys intestinalis]